MKLTPSEELEATAQEIADIVYQKKFSASMELLEMRFLIGEALVASPLWKRLTRANLVKEVESRTGLGERSLRYCAEFKEKYGKWEDVVSFAGGGKLPAWREIIKSLPSGKSETPLQDEESEPKCNHKCPIHCRVEE